MSTHLLHFSLQVTFSRANNLVKSYLNNFQPKFISRLYKCTVQYLYNYYNLISIQFGDCNSGIFRGTVPGKNNRFAQRQDKNASLNISYKGTLYLSIFRFSR